MNFHHLKYFIEVVRHGSINKAATSLFLNPSTLSNVISSMEKELEYSLFIREHNGVRLTKSGEAFYEDAILILSIQDKWNYKKNFIYPQRTDIRIDCIPAIYNSVIHDICYEVSELDSMINLMPYETYLGDLDLPKIKSEQRIAISGYPPNELEGVFFMAKNLGINYSFLYTDYYQVLIRKEHPLAQKECFNVEELKKYPGVAPSAPFIYNLNFLNAYSEDKTKYLYRLTSVMNAITKDDFFCLYPKIIKWNSYCSSGQILIKELQNDPYPISYCLFYPKEDTIERKTRLVVEHIISFFAENISGKL